jgi:predicted DsbA family dithiol-disulfide isomerase
METIVNAKMKVDVWSDVMCPFCYIGKRKYEAALAQVDYADNVEIVWHSFLLNPNLIYQPDKDLYDYVAELKGQTREWSMRMHESLVEAAESVGLEFNLDIAKVANSFDAHRVIQLAKKHGLGDEIEERFFKAYFTEGALISDHDTLHQLAVEIGLDRDEVWKVLNSTIYADEVKRDIDAAVRIGVRGVPFFLMNGKYAVSGAQSPEVFLEYLNKSFLEWQNETG